MKIGLLNILIQALLEIVGRKLIVNDDLQLEFVIFQRDGPAFRLGRIPIAFGFDYGEVGGRHRYQ